MRRKTIILATALFLINAVAFSQTSMKEYKAGHVFYVNLPDYMNKTVGINDASTIQFKNNIKDIAGFIIEDNKEDLKLADMLYSSIDEFYSDFIKDFIKDQEKRSISNPISKTIENRKFIECDASYYDNEVKSELYYFVGIVETKDAFYKVLCYCSLEDKDKFKSDFQKILYSLRD
jgi:hypothetical protein